MKTSREFVRPGRRITIMAATLLTLLLGHATAREIHYGAVTDMDVIACDQLHWRGQADQSRNCYANLLRTGTSLAVRAEAAWALKDLQAANSWFQQAMRENPDDVATRVRWGDLYADSHQDAEAMDIYREVIERDGSNAFARLGAARVLAGSFDDAANAFLTSLLTDGTTTDGARAGALLLSARIALESGSLGEALAALDDAAEIVDRNDWPPLKIYALRAAADLLNNVTASRWTEISLAYNPHYGGIFAVPAHFYVITRRYRGAIDLYQRAIDIESGLASAHEELGVNLLRDNQVSRARKHLVIAHDQDPFSPIAVNTLRLLDSFANFTLVNDPEMPDHAGLVPVTLRLHKEEAAAIAPYAIRLTREAIAEFTDRYDFALKEPVIIEMYPDHEDFAVRTTGMPGLGILGATFGYVVAMDSPSGRPPEQFQWGTTLWHELAHVFTLEASNHLVPRWFSEGISVFEEWRSGPNPGVRIPMLVYDAMKDDRFLPVAELDQGFLRPAYEEQIIVSYMQAGLVCQYIDAAFGPEALSGLLYKYRDGRQTGEAIEEVLGISPQEFDRDFNQFVKSQHGDILDNLEVWQRTKLSMQQKISSSDWPGTIELAKQLLDLLPQYVEPDSPYLALARAQEELGQRRQAIAALKKFWRNGGYDPAALKRLSGWLYEENRSGEAIDVLTSVNLVDPLDQELHGTLGDMLLEAERAQEALTEYSIALALNPHDKAAANYRMASAHHRLGNDEQSQDHLLQALDIAPNFRPAQRLLLDLMRAGSDTQR
ncbi:MAG: tetratricopeptide repeat protein [Gammaproteobacteria bacterium]|nr:MAG: tetratricopeptide repeat protein [Gammaproteobacteria bacterium]